MDPPEGIHGVIATSSSLAWGFRSALSKPHDGDSFFMLVDCGFNVCYRAELRLDGVRAPEIHPPQPGGLETLEFVNGWLNGVQEAAPRRRWPFWIQVVATDSYEPGMDLSFTRYVATVWRYGDQSVVQAQSLNFLVNAFLAVHPEWPSGS